MAATQRVLPDIHTLNLDRLRELVLEQHVQLVSYDNEIENLKLLILKLKRMQFGTSSERLARHIDQLELRLEDLEASRSSRPISTVLQSVVPLRKPARRPLRSSGWGWRSTPLMVFGPLARATAGRKPRSPRLRRGRADSFPICTAAQWALSGRNGFNAGSTTRPGHLLA